VAGTIALGSAKGDKNEMSKDGDAISSVDSRIHKRGQPRDLIFLRLLNASLDFGVYPRNRLGNARKRSE